MTLCEWKENEAKFPAQFLWWRHRTNTLTRNHKSKSRFDCAVPHGNRTLAAAAVPVEWTKSRVRRHMSSLSTKLNIAWAEVRKFIKYLSIHCRCASNTFTTFNQKLSECKMPFLRMRSTHERSRMLGRLMHTTVRIPRHTHTHTSKCIHFK